MDFKPRALLKPALTSVPVLGRACNQLHHFDRAVSVFESTVLVQVQNYNRVAFFQWLLATLMATLTLVRQESHQLVVDIIDKKCF